MAGQKFRRADGGTRRARLGQKCTWWVESPEARHLRSGTHIWTLVITHLYQNGEIWQRGSRNIAPQRRAAFFSQKTPTQR